MLNYHELTMNEPRDSPQRRKQFLVISAIMFLMTVHAGLNAGVFYSMDVTEGTFGGGEFVYKFMRKDYAASTGALRTVASDLGVVEEGGSSNLLIKEKGEEMDTADLLYSVLLDDLSVIPGGDTRFASGLLLPPKSDKGEGQRMKRMLLDANDFIRGDESDDGRHSKDIKYEAGNLPKVGAAVAQHPFTAGAWSAVLQSYKIIPKLKQYAKNRGDAGKGLVVIATCSAKQKMCSYYMPLSKRDKFYMGRPTTEEYAKEFDGASWLQRMGIEFGDAGFSVAGINFGNVFRGMKRAVGLGGSKEGASGGDEL